MMLSKEEIKKFKAGWVCCDKQYMMAEAGVVADSHEELRDENRGLREVLIKVNALIPENPLFAGIRGLIKAALQSEDKG